MARTRSSSVAAVDLAADRLARSRAQIVDQLQALGAAWRAVPLEHRIEAEAVVANENLFDAMRREFGLLSSSEAAVRAGVASTNRQWASDQRRRGRLLGFTRGTNEYRYPGFQFTERGAVHPAVQRVCEIGAAAGVAPQDVAVWFVSPSSWFPDDGRPVDFLDERADLVGQAAESAFATEW